MWIVAVALVANACGHTQPQGPRVEPAAPATTIDRGPTSSESDIGGLSQEDVEDQFKALNPQLVECVRRSAGRLPVIGGRAAVRMRITRAGVVRWVFLTESTLGDREAERCILRMIQDQTWPRPLSGEGLAESSFEVEPGEAAGTWPKHKTAALADRAWRAAARCRKTMAGTYRATAYVGPHGEVLAAGIAPPNAQADEASDCIASQLRSLRVGNLTVGQRTVAKVSFPVR